MPFLFDTQLSLYFSCYIYACRTYIRYGGTSQVEDIDGTFCFTYSLDSFVQFLIDRY